METTKERDDYVPLDEQIERARKICEAQQDNNPQTDSGESVPERIIER